MTTIVTGTKDGTSGGRIFSSGAGFVIPASLNGINITQVELSTEFQVFGNLYLAKNGTRFTDFLNNPGDNSGDEFNITFDKDTSGVSLNESVSTGDIITLESSFDGYVRAATEDSIFTSPTGEPLLYARITYTSTPEEACFTTTCEILTSGGYVNVKDLKKNSKVLNDRNKECKITKVYNRNIKNTTVYKIKENQFGYKLPNKDTIISKNHGFYNGVIWTYPYLEDCEEVNVEEIDLYNFEIDKSNLNNLIVNGLVMESWDGKS